MESNTSKAIGQTNFTHLQGRVDVSYAKLVATFGKPDEGDGYKVDAERAILFDDGVVATIYNYKNGPNYLGAAKGKPVEKITDWHVGGHSSDVVARIHEVLS